MRVNRLEVSHFLGVPKALIDFGPQGVHLFAGPNGAGKSSIHDAVAWALTNRCRGVMVKEASRLATTKGDGSPTTVRVLATSGGQGIDIERTFRGGMSVGTIGGALGFPSADSMLAALHGADLYSMTPEDRAKTIFSASGTQITEEGLRQRGVDDGEIIQMALRRSLNAAERLATERKRAANRTAEAVAQASPADEEIVFPGGQKAMLSALSHHDTLDRLAALRQERNALIRADATSAAKLAAAREAWEKGEATSRVARDRLTAARNIEVETAVEVQAIEASSEVALIAKRNEADEASRDAKAKVIEVLRDFDAAAEALKAAERDVLRAEDSPGCKCAIQPGCPVHVDKATRIATAKAAIEGKKRAFTQADATVRAATEARDVATRKLEELQKALGGVEERLYAAQHRFKNLASDREEAERAFTIAATGAAELLAAYDAKKQAAATAPAPSDDAGSEALAAIDARIAFGESLLARITQRDTLAIVVAKAGVQADAHRATADRYAKMEEALRPGGIVSSILEEPIAAFREVVASAAKYLFREPEETDVPTISVTGDLEIIYKHGELPSGSEVWRIRAALAFALAAVSGLGFVMLDECNLVVGDNRAALIDASIRACEAGIVEQVLLFGATDEEPTQAGARMEKKLMVWHVHDGQIEAAKAKRKPRQAKEPEPAAPAASIGG